MSDNEQSGRQGLEQSVGVAASSAAALPPSGLSPCGSQAKPAAANAGHTPGPWQVASGCDQYVCSSGKWIASTMGVRGEEGASNARLIAAAPELLAACKIALETPGMIKGRDQMMAAIAKAEAK